MRPSRGFLWLGVVLLSTKCSLSSLLSQTTEYITQADSWALCPDSDNDLWIKVGELNFTLYRRQHKLAHSAHKRLLDNSDLHKLQDQHYGILDKIYDYPLIVPSLAIQQGLSNLGDTRRLERFVNKLIGGEPVKIAALGGSVTVGHNVQNKQLAWLYRVFDWVNTTFPHPDHVFINKAIPAVTSGYVAPCVHDLLPDDLDLVFLEFTFNDAERTTNSTDVTDPTRIGLERLVRKLLSMEGQPALINLHYHPFIQPGYEAYYAGSEDASEMIYGYYGVTSISTRRALHRVLNDGSWLYHKLWWPEDPVHPTCIGHRFLSDLVIGLLQDISAHLISTSCCHSTRPSSVDDLYDQLPKSILGNATVESIDKCYMGEDFKGLKNSTQGFEWVNEARQANQEKWGFVSWSVNDTITLQVPVEDVVSRLASNRILIALGVLESYQHMGFLTFSCTNGCLCPPRIVGAHNESPYSLTYWKANTAFILPGSKTCELQVQNIDKTNSGEHKVKITSLLVSSDPGSFIESWTADEERSDD